MQNRAMRECAARRGWMIALQVREVNSGAAKREAREKLLKARRREIDKRAILRIIVALSAQIFGEGLVRNQR